VISPENCSAILWRTWDYKERAAESLKLTAENMLQNKLIDGIIPEPLGGAHYDPEKMAATLKDRILSDLKELQDKDTDELVNERIEKFTSMGVVSE
jgi:acetyl-CoA carboxylase carboxyl transferase subunit alpha